MYVPESFSGRYYGWGSQHKDFESKSYVAKYLFTIGGVFTGISGASYHFVHSLKADTEFQRLRHRKIAHIESTMVMNYLCYAIHPFLLPAAGVLLAGISLLVSYAVHFLALTVFPSVTSQQITYFTIGTSVALLSLLRKQITGLAQLWKNAEAIWFSEAPKPLVNETKYYYRDLIRRGVVEKTPLTSDEINDFDYRLKNEMDGEVVCKEFHVLADMNKIPRSLLEKINRKYSTNCSERIKITCEPKLKSYLYVQFARNNCNMKSCVLT